MTLPENYLKAISEHIIDVINYLHTKKFSDTSSDNSCGDENSQYKTSDDKQISHTQSQSEPERYSILLISDIATANKVHHYIKQSASRFIQSDLNHLDIVSLSLDDFVELPFDKRYTLGCFIDPIIGSTNIGNTNIGDTNIGDTNIEELLVSGDVDGLIKWNQLKTIAIKLRDLFAQQSLIFLPPQNPDYPLNSYGFEMAVLEFDNLNIDNLETASDYYTESTTTNRQISCWQFNLYDYKRRPDWLNAKYWANPENFDKYRW